MTEQVNSYNGRVQSNDPPRGYPWIDVATVESGDEFAVRTIEAIMLDVGDNAELAAAAMAEEKAREEDGIKPRITLIARLQKVIDDAE